jgi:hypothetical protein
MLHSLTSPGRITPSAKMLAEAIHPYTSQYAAKTYYQVWNQ